MRERNWNKDRNWQSLGPQWDLHLLFSVPGSFQVPLLSCKYFCKWQVPPLPAPRGLVFSLSSNPQWDYLENFNLMGSVQFLQWSDTKRQGNKWLFRMYSFLPGTTVRSIHFPTLCWIISCFYFSFISFSTYWKEFFFPHITYLNYSFPSPYTFLFFPKSLPTQIHLLSVSH